MRRKSLLLRADRIVSVYAANCGFGPELLFANHVDFRFRGCSGAALGHPVRSGLGTFETCRPALRTSVDRGRPEVVGAQVKTTHTDRRYLRSYPASVLSGLLRSGIVAAATVRLLPLGAPGKAGYGPSDCPLSFDEINLFFG